MAERLPIVRPRVIIRALERAGFVLDHQTGSHLIFWHPETEHQVTVAMHNRDVKRGTLASIIKQSGLEADILYISKVEPYPEQESEDLGDEVIARLNPDAGEVDNLESIFFSTPLLQSDLLGLPVAAELRLSEP